MQRWTNERTILGKSGWLAAAITTVLMATSVQAEVKLPNVFGDHMVLQQGQKNKVWGVAAAGAPKTIVGIAIALLVLLPEGFAAVRAAKANRLQSSLNLALGSALASIGLTIPAVAAIAIFFDLPLSLGISGLNMTLMYLSLFIGALTLAIGRTTLLQGVVHLIIFCEYLFLSLVP